jgi:glycosyltransferase involved in cell wall biosynthesis
MQIIHIVLGKADPDRLNGVNRAVWALANTQAELGADVKVWGITPTPQNVPTYKANYALTLFKKQPFRTVDPALKTALKVTLSKNKRLIVHLHGGFIIEWWWLSRFLTQNGIGYVVTPHNTYNEGAMANNALLKKLSFVALEVSFLKKAACVHLLGISEQRGIEKLAAEASIHLKIIPNGYSAAETEGVSPVRLPLQTDTGLSIVYCGRLTIYQKGLDLMLQSFARFVQAHQNLDGKLYLIGDGEDRGKLEALAKELGVEQQVCFLGARFGNEKLGLMLAANYFIHTSRFEGIPMAVLEAASLGKPCLVTHETNMADSVKAYNAGFVAKSLEVEDLTALFEEAYASKSVNLLNTMGQSAKNMIETQFNQKHVAQQIIKVYEEVLKS